MVLILHWLEQFEYEHPIIWWLLTALLSVILGILALGCGVTAVLLFIAVFYTIYTETAGAGTAFVLTVLSGYMACILGKVSSAIMPDYI
jgi:hypothetical protein